MRERLEGMLGGTARAIWILTFHAACGRILRREAERLGYRSTFTIYDDQDQVRLTKACLEELGKDPKRFSPRGIHSQISRMKNELVLPEEALTRVASFWDQTVAETYDVYQRRLHASNAVDFDDLLMLTVQVLERFPEARIKLAEGVPLHPRRRVPGHEPRAVPPAPAARCRARERLCRGRPGPVDLRVPGGRHPQHHGVRARLPRHARDRPRAELPLDEQDPSGGERGHRREPRAEAEEPLLRPRRGRARSRDRGGGRARRGPLRRGRDRGLIDSGCSASEIAVFYRTNAQSRVLEDVLVRQDVPYQVIGGPRFYERAEIRDATAYLSVLVNPSDAGSLLRIANRPRRGIGAHLAGAARGVRGGARAARSGRRMADPEAAGVTSAACRAIRGFHATMESLMALSQELPVDELLERAPGEDGDARRARGRADDRGPGPHREPAGARRRRARVPPADRGRVARRLPPGHRPRLRPGHDLATTAASSR